MPTLLSLEVIAWPSLIVGPALWVDADLHEEPEVKDIAQNLLLSYTKSAIFRDEL